MHYYIFAAQNLVFLGILKGWSFSKKDHLLSGAAAPQPQPVKGKQSVAVKHAVVKTTQPVKGKQSIVVKHTLVKTRTASLPQGKKIKKTLSKLL